MDLLCVPDNPSGSPGRVAYRCREQWDGGDFRSYAHRKKMSRIIPSGLREVPGLPAPDEPHLELLYPTPREELEPFLQTWLFFGLTAEFLALNEYPMGHQLIEKAEAKEQIEDLHRKCVGEDKDGKYLSGAEILKAGQLMRERIRLAPNLEQRLLYLRGCLHYAGQILHSISANLDDSIRFSIAAVGEIFSTGLFAATRRASPKIELPLAGFNWNRNYLRAGGIDDVRMLENGWCISEVEKIRSFYQGLFTMHYLSRLRMPQPHADHGQCTKYACKAFQMDIESYEPLHVDVACKCEHIVIDEVQVESILRDSDSFPVLRFQGGHDETQRFGVEVEKYHPDVPYVALSHVWAHGLGNPRQNSLPRCQMIRLSKIINALHAASESSPLGEGQTYRLWIDSLCCPVKLYEKTIALERIAQVYRQAAHVLVLDQSLLALHTRETHPAEMLLRTFACSPWMRRLWTLQEGALAKNLCVEFADRAMGSWELLQQLYVLGLQDTRYLRIWQDAVNEFTQMQTFGSRDGNSIAAQTRPQLTSLSRVLHYRTVSVPADEPLCIATLLNLDPKYIAAVTSRQDRMVRVWELISRLHGGLPARLIFFVDSPLDIRGWRWAPGSLLGSAANDTTMGVDERVMRFAEMDVTGRSVGRNMGTPTPLGLKVQYPGCRLVPRPRLPGIPLHPWPDLIKPTEDQVPLYIENTGKWMRIIDWYRSQKLPHWTPEEKVAYDREFANPLCEAIDTGKCALICENKMGTTVIEACCMVLIEESSPENLNVQGQVDGGKPLMVRRQRTAILSPLTDAECTMMDIVRRLADEVAADEATAALLSIKTRDGKTWKVAQNRVRQRMKDAIAHAWETEPALAQTVEDTIGPDMKEYMWAFIPKVFSHDVSLEELPPEQEWIVD